MFDSKEAPSQYPHGSKEAQLSARNAFINDLHTASCFFRLERNGVPFLQEYDHDLELHRISDWPGAFKQDAEGYWVPSDTFEPFDLIAEPMTLHHQDLPQVSFTIEPGMKVVWAHRVRTNRPMGAGLNADDANVSIVHEDTMIVGRVLADGTEEIATIYPDGAQFDHASFPDAIAHSK